MWDFIVRRSGVYLCLFWFLSRNQNKHRGVVDSLVEVTAIEYEGNLQNSTKFKTGYKQVEKYWAGLLNDGYPVTNVRGILSDTV